MERFAKGKVRTATLLFNSYVRERRRKKTAGILLLKMENVFRVASARVALLDERMDRAKSHRGLPLPPFGPRARGPAANPDR